MKRSTCIALASVSALLFSGSAQALAFRAYLSASGNDGNPCTVAAPCRLLPAALAAVASGGEIWILDSANYNPGTVSITKSVSILAVPGAIGSFAAVSGGPALIITGVDVKLRNVLIVSNVASPGTDGIQISGGSLEVTGSAISAPVNGINATNAAIRVYSTIFRDLDTAIQSFGSSTIDVANSRFSNIATAGLWAHADTPSAAGKLSVEDSSFANVAFSVIANSENATATMKAMVSRCTFAIGSTAISFQNAGGTGARGSVTGSTISNHSSAFLNFNNAVFESAGNNTVGSTNGSPSFGTITTIGTI